MHFFVFTQIFRQDILKIRNLRKNGVEKMLEKAIILAAKVKRADLMDNMDISRIPNPTEKDEQRLKNMKLHCRESKKHGRGEPNGKLDEREL